jgi:hypothetical protein
VHVLRSFTAGAALLVAASAVCLAACGRPAGGPIVLTLDSPDRASVTGLTSAESAGLRDAKLSNAELAQVLRVRLPDADVAISGRYVIADGRIDFTPSFPFDRGRRYTLELFTARLQRPGEPGVIAQTLALPGEAETPLTRVLSVDPTSDVWPANILRVYIHFSNAMGLESGVGKITLRESQGAEVAAAFVPIEADYFNQDRTRYTLFFDPGRVKRGILPNRQYGRALVAGRRYVLEISASWPDARMRPLAADFRREFQAGPAIESPLRMEDWQFSDVVAGGTAPLAVTFPWPIDRGLAARAFAIAGPDGRAVEGQAELEAGDCRWVFVPTSPWTAGSHQFLTQPALEDVSGNQVNRAFETSMSKAPEGPPANPKPRTFVVRPGTQAR